MVSLEVDFAELGVVEAGEGVREVVEGAADDPDVVGVAENGTTPHADPMRF